MRKIRLGVCGAGLCAQLFHLPALQKTADVFEPVAVCSATEEQCAEYAKKLGISLQYFTDWKQLVASPDVEAILCSFPYFLSDRIIRECVRQRKHLLIEKPLCDTTDAARALAALDLKDTVVGVAENWIYFPAVAEAKAVIASGEIGDLCAAYITSLYEMELDSDWLTKTTWRKTAKGGMVLDRAIHQVAFERAVVGDVAEACGLTQCVRPVLGEADTMFTVFRHKNGVIGSLNVCASAGNLETDHGMAFVGTEGTLKIGGFMTDFMIHGKNGDRSYTVDNGDGGYEAELRDFYAAITTGKELESSLRKAAMDLNTALAPLEQPGRWLKLSAED